MTNAEVRTVDVTFVSPSGSSVTVAGRPGETIMQVAVLQDVSGILAECGGALACATCHVFVDGNCFSAPTPMEAEMLEATAVPRRSDSRLACQLILTSDMKTVQVGLPEVQV